ncbi:energy transducer TonB [Epibacterium sp. SM1979]|uniref:Energy transducer TonB n=1 Tax=Tritonibacter litoralis TaxID=2662264 RepID=A0A843YDD3_9RHOB|nr:energy transducer TonB [Tritonibacter litoralis]
MQTGTKISVAAHGLLMSWVFFGAWFPSEPLPSQVQEVSLISAAEFARLSQEVAAPDLSPEPATLAVPDTASLPEVATPPSDELDVATPDPVTPVAPDPVVDERPDPLPDVQPEALTEITPPAPVEVPDLPTPIRPAERPDAGPQVDRVAPVPVAPPPPDVAPAEVAQPEIAPEEGSETPQEIQEATAPEAASDRIVTEENQSDSPVASAAPTQSVRPIARPRRPTPAPEPEPTVAEAPADPAPETAPEPEPQPDAPADRADAVGDALAEALAGGADVEAPEPSGPPLTSGERDALRVAVSGCWNVGSLSSEALRTTVIVGVSLSQDGKPDQGSIRMLSSTGGSAAAAQQAFQTARRAIIRCGARGFDLPPEKYAQWRDIEMTFNPERMRNR